MAIAPLKGVRNTVSVENRLSITVLLVLASDVVLVLLVSLLRNSVPLNSEKSYMFINSRDF